MFFYERIKCSVFNTICQLCSKKGHFANVRRSNKATVNVVTADKPVDVSTISAASPLSLYKATVPITVNYFKAEALIDTEMYLS